MDEKIKFIEKYKKMGYEIEDDNGVIIFYIGSYDKHHISDIRKIINESKYDCSWGIRPSKGAVKESAGGISMNTDENVSDNENEYSSNVTPFKTEEYSINDDLEEEMAKMPLDSDEKAGSKEESSNKEASLNDELQEKPMIFTQESLFDLF